MIRSACPDGAGCATAEGGTWHDHCPGDRPSPGKVHSMRKREACQRSNCARRLDEVTGHLKPLPDSLD